MPISVPCPSCGLKLKAPDAAAGKRAKCPKCGTAVAVPTSAGPRAPGLARLAEPERIKPTRLATVPSAMSNHVPAGRQHAHSLGIASLVLGVLGLLLFCFPFAGLSFAAVGLLLGLAGLAISFRRKGSGAGFSIAGIFVSAVAVVPGAIVALGLMGLREAFRQVAPTQQVVQATPQGRSPPRDNKQPALPQKAGLAPKPKPAQPPTPRPLSVPTKLTEEEEWQEADKGSVQVGDVSLSVSFARIGRPTLTSAGGRSANLKDECLILGIHVENQSDVKKLRYSGWSGDAFESHRPTLTDDLGNRYARMTLGLFDKYDGSSTDRSIYPQKHTDDVIVFERPVDKASLLRIRLPADAFGEKGEARFAIPASMISR